VAVFIAFPVRRIALDPSAGFFALPAFNPDV